MHTNELGATGLTCSRLGLGLGQLGALDDAAAQRVLERALELGINVFDAAVSYGRAEAHLARFIDTHRSLRPSFIVSTKGGYGVDSEPDWTARCVTRGVDQALERIGVDSLEVFFLHSCPLSTLEHHGVYEALVAAKAQGKVRAIGYSGENEALAWALSRFDVVQCSVNVADQRSSLAWRANGLRVGVFAKRALANSVWRYTERPTGRYGDVYWDRLAAMGLDFGARWPEVAVRFAAFAPHVSCALVGTSNPEHLDAAARAVALGPLDESERVRITSAFERHAHDSNWRGEI